MTNLLQDLRYALRQLTRSPGFAATVIVTLALGIGANSAIFTIFDQVLLRMLPVAHPEQLVRFHWTGEFQGSTSSFGGGRENYFSYPMYRDLKARNTVFTDVVAADRTNLGVSWRGQAETKDAELVSGNYFDMLGLKPTVGRLFNQADETAKGANPVVVLSRDYWKMRFNSDPGVGGQTLLVNGHPFTIVGVAPDGFRTAIGGYKPALFLPLSMSEMAIPGRATLDDWNNHKSVWLTLAARLKPGVTRQQAEAAMGPLWHSLRAEELNGYQGESARFRQSFLNSHLSVIDDSGGFNPQRDDLRMPLLVLMGMVGVLAAMCAVNTATLLLLRAAGRVREISMRYALGASRTRIVSQLLIEGAVLGACGAVAGVALCPSLSQAMVRLMMSSDSSNESPYSSTLDVRVLAFALGLGLVVSVLFSVAPALQFLRPRLAESLRQSSGTASRTSQRFRKMAVGFQIFLTVLLIGGAGLFLRTLDHLRSQNLGFEVTHLTSFDVDPTMAGYGDERSAQVEAGVLAAVRQIPGVMGAAGTTDAEVSNNSNTDNYTIQGHVQGEDEDMTFESPRITSDYFQTLHQPILAGREFKDSDSKDSPKVAVVNLTLAKRFFGSPQNALGHLLAQGAGDKLKVDTMIVGVVGDVKHQNLRDAPRGAVYRPYVQQEHPGGLRFYALSAQDPSSVEATIRERIHRLDPKLVADQLQTMEDQINQTVSNERALAMLAMAFSGLAAVLTGVGLYGVLAFATSQRTREIGVRMALGAQRSSVVMLVLREMAVTAGIGIGLALPAAYLLSRLMRTLLYGVEPGDPLTFALAVMVSAAMVLLAAAVPARRAASIDPNQALRSE